MYLTKDLALRMESCIKQTHIKMAQAHPLGKVLELGEGAACFAGYSSFFSQVIAWGFNLSVKQFKTQIQTIEQFYRSLNHTQVDIELCPLVGNDLLMALSQRGYTIAELNNVSFFDLTQHKMVTDSTNFDIRPITTAEIETWAKKVALGFGYLEAQEQFAQYARLKEVTAFAVYEQGQIIAGGTIGIHDGVADLGVTSTLPAYRGRGVQRLLLNNRLNYAHEQHIPLAIVTTAPGSISDLNVQKVGFRCAYTRLKLTKKID
jgi:GNAT superfamily N-acetyltransferase